MTWHETHLSVKFSNLTQIEWSQLNLTFQMLTSPNETCRWLKYRRRDGVRRGSRMVREMLPHLIIYWRKQTMHDEKSNYSVIHKRIPWSGFAFFKYTKKIWWFKPWSKYSLLYFDANILSAKKNLLDKIFVFVRKYCYQRIVQ